MRDVLLVRFYRRGVLFALAGFLSLYSAWASALPYTLVIDTPDRTAIPGDTVIFQGTITNNTGADVSAIDLFLDFSGYDPMVLTPIQLLGDTDFVIPDGGTSALVDLFSMDVDLATPPGTYYADVFVQDGVNPPNFSDIATISITVAEPQVVALLAAGLLALVAVRRRRA